jgi:hypothetical protein
VRQDRNLSAPYSPCKRLALSLAQEKKIRSNGADIASGNVSYRSLLVGGLLAAILGVGTPYENLIISGSPLHLDYSTPAAVFLFFLLYIVVNPLLFSLRRSWVFSRAELVTIYIMGSVACTVSTIGLVCVLIPHISAGIYFATPENGWESQVLPYMASWLRVNDEQAIKFFFEGLPRGASIPWSAWGAPLAAWAVLILAFFAAMTALMVIVRKQWIEHERLTFPLVQVPIAMIGEEGQDTGVISNFFKNPVVWIGILIPVLLYSQRALHNYFPIIPEGMPISESWYFWNNKFRLRLSLSYAVLGFGYLLSVKLGFSMWFLGLMTMFENALLHYVGWAGTDRVVGSSLGTPNLLYQGFGALGVLVLSSLWIGRRHLLDVLRGFRRPNEDDGREILSYRQAGLLLLFSGAIMTGWCILSGMSWWLAPIFLLVAFLLMFAITRIVAEGGLAVTKPTMMPNDVMVGALGTETLGPTNIGALGMTYPWVGQMRTTMMAAVIHGLKLAESYTLDNRRRLFWAIMLAGMVSTSSSVLTVLITGYRYGALNLSEWFFGVGSATQPYSFVDFHLANPQPASEAFYSMSAVGGLVQLLLTLANARFLWWPIHPIAFPVSAYWTTHHLMPSIFIAWAIKSVVLHYGGVVLYRKTRPFFLGLILGHYVAGGLWIVIDGFTGMTANYLFYW